MLGPKLEKKKPGACWKPLPYSVPYVGKDAAELKNTVGVVDHGIFANMATAVIVAGKDGIRVAGEGGEKPWW
jgi:hypothetical protein